jgi:hypothetical protein
MFFICVLCLLTVVLYVVNCVVPYVVNFVVLCLLTALFYVLLTVLFYFFVNCVVLSSRFSFTNKCTLY